MDQYLPLSFLLLAAGLLALMSYQDWQTRSISWPAFPALGLALLAGRLWRLPALQVGQELLLSWASLALLLALLALYVRWRWPALALRDCLGSGDVLFWAMAAVYFSPEFFLAFFIGSSLVALVVAGVMYWRQPVAAASLRIPLAGVQAACLLVLLLFEQVLPDGAAYPLAALLPSLPTP